MKLKQQLGHMCFVLSEGQPGQGHGRPQEFSREGQTRGMDKIMRLSGGRMSPAASRGGAPLWVCGQSSQKLTTYFENNIHIQ